MKRVISRMKGTLRKAVRRAGYIKNITIKRIPITDVIIFEATTAGFIKEHILGEMNSLALAARAEVFYLRPAVVLFTLGYFFEALFLESRKSLICFSQSLLIAYFKACIRVSRAKVVVTYIDNSPIFSRLSREYKRATFMAIQNGNRWVLDVMIRDCCLTHFFCFGRLEKDLYSKHGFSVGHFYPIGSLRADVAKYKFNDRRNDLEEFDICLISSWKFDVMNGTQLAELGTAFSTLTDFLVSFLGAQAKNSYRVGIACCGLDEREQDYFKMKFGDSVRIIPNNRNEYTTYKVMDRSKVILNLISTAAVEAFGRGKKTLFCNFTEMKKYDFPVDGIWSLNESNYEVFAQKLQNLLHLSDAEYRQVAADIPSYFMSFPQNTPNYMLVKQVIQNLLQREERTAVQGPLPINASL